jgi:transcriptional regulator with XRE-family HTH domain
MSAKSRNTPPPEIKGYVADISAALTAISEGEDRQDDLYRALDGAVRTAAKLGRPVTAGSTWSQALEATFGDIIGDNVKALRNEAGWSQAAVAEAMASLGFDWKRITMAQTEAAVRRVTFEELLGLAVLFAVPVVELLLPQQAPDDQTVLEWHSGVLPPSVLLELLLGSSGALGRGGLTWRAAARAAGAPRGARDWRPAADLWAGRREQEG